jgi:hypothetical protein
MKSLSLILAALAALTFVSCSSTPSAAKAGTAPKAKNLALGKTATSNNHILDFSSDKSVDGDTASYFEGAANAYPNLLTIDLEKKVSLKSVTIRLNPRKIWTGRTQTFSILVSDDGTTFTTAVPSADYDFSPLEGGNSVTVPVKATGRFVQISFTANTEATGGQAAEVEIDGE